MAAYCYIFLLHTAVFNLEHQSHESIRDDKYVGLCKLLDVYVEFSLAHFVSDPQCAKLISPVGKRLYVNALTESERLNDTEYRSETCSEAELIVVRSEQNEPLVQS